MSADPMTPQQAADLLEAEAWWINASHLNDALRVLIDHARAAAPEPEVGLAPPPHDVPRRYDTPDGRVITGPHPPLGATAATDPDDLAAEPLAGVIHELRSTPAGWLIGRRDHLADAVEAHRCAPSVAAPPRDGWCGECGHTVGLVPAMHDDQSGMECSGSLNIDAYHFGAAAPGTVRDPERTT